MDDDSILESNDGDQPLILEAALETEVQETGIQSYQNIRSVTAS